MLRLVCPACGKLLGFLDTDSSRVALLARRLRLFCKRCHEEVQPTLEKE